MSTKIRHVAIHTDDHFRMAHFYKTLFGMKKITAGMTDQNGNYYKAPGHSSDGVNVLALPPTQHGTFRRLGPFRFQCSNVLRLPGNSL